MCSLVMSLFSRDYIKIDQLKYQQSFNLITCVQLVSRSQTAILPPLFIITSLVGKKGDQWRHNKKEEAI